MAFNPNFNSNFNHNQIDQFNQINCYQSKGTTFYLKPGEKIQDYPHLKRYPDQKHFFYHKLHRTLICCECDLSFSRAIVDKRGNGKNMKSTMWYYPQQWNGKKFAKSIRNRVGKHHWQVYHQNWKYIKKAKCKVIFGVDATQLNLHGHRFGGTFDRILCTFPRVTKTGDWASYNEKNTIFMRNVLQSYRQYLSNIGEIHMLLFRDQFCHWKMNKSLNDLGMRLAYWCPLNLQQLNHVYPGYTCRDSWGNYMKLLDENDNPLLMHLCCFTKAAQMHPTSNYFSQAAMKMGHQFRNFHSSANIYPVNKQQDNTFPPSAVNTVDQPLRPKRNASVSANCEIKTNTKPQKLNPEAAVFNFEPKPSSKRTNDAINFTFFGDDTKQ